MKKLYFQHSDDDNKSIYICSTCNEKINLTAMKVAIIITVVFVVGYTLGRIT